MTDLEDLLAEGRAAAEAVMTDECLITVAGGPDVFDDDTGVRTPADRVTLYPVGDAVGICRIQLRQVQADVPTSGDHRYVLSTTEISLPITAPTVPPDARIDMTGSQFDPANVGRVFTAVAGLRKSQATAYRLQCEEVLG